MTTRQDDTKRGDRHAPSRGVTDERDPVRTDRVTGVTDHVTPLTESATPTKWGADRDPHPPNLPLVTLLNHLRAQGVTLNVTPHTVTPSRPLATHEQHTLDRHHHALHLAATGTHPTWWNWASARDRTTTPDPDDLPWTCTTCGTPNCAHLDADLLAWCDHHWHPHPEQAAA